MKNDIRLTDTAFESLLLAAEGNPRAMVALAKLAAQRGLRASANTLAARAAAEAPDDPVLAIKAREVFATTVPGFHVPMIRDQPRNQAFEQALQRAVTPETVLLDIGSGTGLLALMAARAGAKHVYSCEGNAAMAAVAKDIVRTNGYADRITIIPKYSTDVDCDTDLGGPVNLVVAEIIGRDFVCENVLPSMQDVAKRLVKPGVRMIPASGDIMVALAWWDGLAARFMGVECGFDMTPFNRLVRPNFSLNVGNSELEIRGTPAALFSFDFTAEAHDNDISAQLSSTGGLVNGVIQWIRLQMDETADFENRPEHGTKSSWACQFYPFAQPLDLQDGDTVRIAASHADDTLRIWEQ